MATFAELITFTATPDTAQLTAAENYLHNKYFATTGNTAVSITSQTPSTASTVLVTAGQPLTLTVAATGAAPLSYQWRRDGTVLGSFTGAQLQILSSSLADSGSYTVTVNNIVGTPQTPAAWSVVVTSCASVPTTCSTLFRQDCVISVDNPPNTCGPCQSGYASGATYANTACVPLNPTITQQPAATATLSLGESVQLSVSATTDPLTGALSYQWRRNGDNIGGATGSSYTVGPAASSGTEGAYTVLVSNALGGSVLSSATQVSVRPAVTAWSPTGSVLSRTEVTVEVEFDAAVSFVGAASAAFACSPACTVNSASALSATRIRGVLLPSQQGAFSVSLVAGTVQRASSGATNLAATSPASFSYDSVAPTLSFSGPSTVTTVRATVTLQSNEALSPAPTAANFFVTNGVPVSVTHVAGSGNTQFLVAVDATRTGTVTVLVGNGITDAAGNAVASLSASISFTFACASGFFGQRCACNLTSQLLTTEYPARLRAGQGATLPRSGFAADQLTLVVEESLKFDAAQTTTLFDTTCSALTPQSAWSFTEVEGDGNPLTSGSCVRVWSITAPWLSVIGPDSQSPRSCGVSFTDSVGGVRTWRSAMSVRSFERISAGGGSGAPVWRPITSSLPWQLDFPLEAAFAQAVVTAYSSVFTASAISEQSAFRASGGDTAMLARVRLVTSVQSPFFLRASSVVLSTPNGIAMVSAPAIDAECGGPREGLCSNTWTIVLREPNVLCNFNGAYSLEFTLGCRGPANDCPLDAQTDRATVAFSLASSNHCPMSHGFAASNSCCPCWRRVRAAHFLALWRSVRRRCGRRSRASESDKSQRKMQARAPGAFIHWQRSHKREEHLICVAFCLDLRLEVAAHLPRSAEHNAHVVSRRKSRVADVSARHVADSAGAESAAGRRRLVE
jgi:hypothetical protein